MGIAIFSINILDVKAKKNKLLYNISKQLLVIYLILKSDNNDNTTLFFK